MNRGGWYLCFVLTGTQVSPFLCRPEALPFIKPDRARPFPAGTQPDVQIGMANSYEPDSLIEQKPAKTHTVILSAPIAPSWAKWEALKHNIRDDHRLMGCRIRLFRFMFYFHRMTSHRRFLNGQHNLQSSPAVISGHLGCSFLRSATYEMFLYRFPFAWPDDRFLLLSDFLTYRTVAIYDHTAFGTQNADGAITQARCPTGSTFNGRHG